MRKTIAIALQGGSIQLETIRFPGLVTENMHKHAKDAMDANGQLKTKMGLDNLPYNLPVVACLGCLSR